ncbi:MAG: CDP-alcohol phosphatidyltransferase family protein [Candidatus Margulisbacteria bacterium]|nr:CDP-alcohol phosphatidyltransferase family protein [Candidatus Margulisiibacteriota bacterium]
MTTTKRDSQELQPTILSYVKDLPNLCSLAGLACTIVAIYFSIVGVYYAAMISMIWAVAFDWADGLIARRMKSRSGNDSKFGGQLDVIIDIVSYGVTPAILLLSYGEFDPIYLVGAFIMVAASAIRLSYFSTYGLSGGAKYTGLALDNNSIILVFIFLLEGFLSEGTFSVILYASGLGLAALNISQIKTPKLSSNPINVYILAVYTLAITGIYVFKLCLI